MTKSHSSSASSRSETHQKPALGQVRAFSPDRSRIVPPPGGSWCQPRCAPLRGYDTAATPAALMRCDGQAPKTSTTLCRALFKAQITLTRKVRASPRLTAGARLSRAEPGLGAGLGPDGLPSLTLATDKSESSAQSGQACDVFCQSEDRCLFCAGKTRALRWMDKLHF